VHLGPVWVLEDWWSIIRGLTVCQEFCRVSQWKRQYRRYIKIYMAYDEEKGKKSWRSLGIMEFLFYLCPRSSVQSREMHWVSWWSANHWKITSKPIFPENRTYPPIWPDSSNLIWHVRAIHFPQLIQTYPGPQPDSSKFYQTCPAPRSDMSGLLHSSPRLSTNRTYSAWELGYSNQTQTYSVPGPDMSGLWVITQVKF
jgi:hypothetical protein